MATSKTLAPTNVTISIPAMTDQPNASVLANCADKEADAINALNSQIGNFGTITSEWASNGSPVTFSPPKTFGIIIFKIPTTASTAQTSIGYYVKQNGYVVFSWIGTPSSYLTVTTSGVNVTLATTAGNGTQASCIGFG